MSTHGYKYPSEKKSKQFTDPLIGKRFGNLIVIKRIIEGCSILSVKCDCGNTNIFKAHDLKCGRRTSCGYGCNLKKGKKNGNR